MTIVVFFCGGQIDCGGLTDDWANHQFVYCRRHLSLSSKLWAGKLTASFHLSSSSCNFSAGQKQTPKCSKKEI